VSASVAGVVLQKALEQAGTIDNVDKVREALLALDLKDTIFGPIKFENPNGINKARHAAALQIQNGKFVPVYPPDVKKAAFEYPFKPWSERSK
jgi:hypothetical protein